jgi:hypothetical protein
MSATVTKTFRNEAPAVVTRPTFLVAERIRIAREAIRQHRYIPMGKVLSIVIGASKGAAVPDPETMRVGDSLSKRIPLALDWLGLMHNPPVLAYSEDNVDLLLPGGVSKLPDAPDPRHIPRSAADVAPRIPQRMEDRATGRIMDGDVTRYLVFSPVVQVAFIAAGEQKSGFGLIKGGKNPADHSRFTLLINPRSMNAYFVGGTWELVSGRSRRAGFGEPL